MKKGFKAASAAIIAMSALTPAAVFADTATETAAVSPGIYTTSNHYTFQEFRELTRDQKVNVLRDTTGLFVVANVVINHKQATTSSSAALTALLNDPNASINKYLADGVTFGENGHDGYVPGEDPIDLTVESVSAINKTKVEVKFNKEVDAVSAENFTIEGAAVTAATLSEDKKTVVLSVSGLEYDATYNVVIDGVLIDGKEVEGASKAFDTPAVTDLWNLQIVSKASEIKADGADNTEVTFKLVDKTTGNVDVDADNIVLDLNTTYGTLAQKRVTIQNGVATVLLTSEFSNKAVTAKIDAQIIEASGDYQDLRGVIEGTANVKFVTDTYNDINPVILESAEANQVDRLTLFFDNPVSLYNFVETNSNGELLFTIDGSGAYTAKYIQDSKIDAARVAHLLIGDIEISQTSNENIIVKGLKPVAGNAHALEVVLDKATVLRDNDAVSVVVNAVNSAGKFTESDTDFKVTDARQPEATSVSVEGLNTLKVKFSEAMENANFRIDGEFDEVNNHFSVEFGEYNPATQVDNRDLATIKLLPGYDEDGIADNDSENETKAGFFSPGGHTLQISSSKDFAYATDRNNLGTTQNLTFNIEGDETKPNATVEVESPEQYRVTFDKVVAREGGGDLTAADFELQYYDTDAKEYKEVTVGGDFEVVPNLVVEKVNGSEYVVEIDTDWTEVFATKTSKVNFYNHKFQLVLAEDTVENVVNGETNEKIVLDLNYNNSALNTPDTSSANITSIVQTLVDDVFVVTMDEPVKLYAGGAAGSLDNAGATLNEDQTVLPQTSVQFIGKNKDGKTVTIDGTVDGYADTNGADNTFFVSADLQNLVDVDGYSEDWTLVVKSLSDDVGNTVSTETLDFEVKKSPAGETPFFVDINGDREYKVAGYLNGEEEDTVEITFSEGVQVVGTSDATNPAQYTLNGKTLPVGTSIKVANDSSATHATQEGREKVIITLPNNTLLGDTNESNVITINKNLVSYDGSELEGDFEFEFVVDSGEEDNEPNPDLARQQAATEAIEELEGQDTVTQEDIDAAQALVDVVTDETIKAELQERLDAIEVTEEEVQDVKLGTIVDVTDSNQVVEVVNDASYVVFIGVDALNANGFTATTESTVTLSLNGNTVTGSYNEAAGAFVFELTTSESDVPNFVVEVE